MAVEIHRREYNAQSLLRERLGGEKSDTYCDMNCLCDHILERQMRLAFSFTVNDVLGN
jgi:hypothetical protein